MHIQGKFYPDLWMSFSPHCNALIGVKGSGKTSLLEALRFALGATVPTSRQESVRSHLDSILGPNGTVRVLVKRADGAKVIVERTQGKAGFTLRFDDGRAVDVATPDALLFPSYILGWHEIEQAATDSNVRQVYLDTIAGQEGIRSLREAADSSAKEIRHLHEVASTKYAAFRSLHDQIQRLEDLRKGLQELSDSNLISLKDEYERAVQHREAIQQLGASVALVAQNLDERLSSIRLAGMRQALEGASPVSDEAARAAEVIQTLDQVVGQFSDSHKSSLQQAAVSLQNVSKSAEEKFSTFLGIYRARFSELPPDKQRLLESHRRVMEDTKALPRLVSEQDTHRREIDEILGQLVAASRSVAEKLDRRTQVRQEAVEQLNKELATLNVQLAVEPLAIRSRLESLSQQYSAGAKIYGELNNFASQERRYHARLARAYENLRADLVGGFRLFFETSEFMYFVDYFEEDDLKIRFKVGKAGEEFSPIDQMSAGQRCTAIFPLLLKLREGPLIVDQPEDNLDNRHIADVISSALMVDKRKRQIAFTSHNANLVVLTDAEHICAFESNGSEGYVSARGFLCAKHSLITPQVMGILDGGDRALEFRYRKYGTAGRQ